MKYFAIAGKNQQLSKYELSLIGTNIAQYGAIFLFDTDNFEKCKYLAGFTKVGEIVNLEKFINEEKKLVGTNINLTPKDKQKYNIKRYKKVDLLKTDLEVKSKGIEVIFIKELPGKVGIVKFYQNIKLYETIDFFRPIRSMQIGMMPSKLTHLLINFSTKLNYQKTIYDPFVGLGTTAMVGNYLQNHIIASDLNPIPCKENWKFWQTTEFYNPNYKFTCFKQDITKPFKNKFVKFTTNVVSEGFLGPKVGKFLNEKEAFNLEKSFQNIYIEGVKNILTLPNLQNITITLPAYKLKNKQFYLFSDTLEKIKKLGVNIQAFDEIYYRPGQKVGRQIVLINP